MLGESAAPADRAALRQALGLDRPLVAQYGAFLAGLATGDLGRSVVSGEPVARLVAARIPATVELTLGALAVAIAIALPLGVLAAARPGTWIDRGAVAFALLGAAMPSFWLGPLLIIAFAIELQILPVSGRGGLAHLVLPACTLGVGMAAILTRMTRASVLECVGEDYVRTARAKGVGRVRVLARHALANALAPVITILGLQFGALLAGTVITETIFAWPGVGRLTVEGIQARDYPVLQGCILAIAAGFVLASTLADIVNAALDPRTREAR
ncbi:MAG: ABC transporter permease [Deltaproteobacteria bacterium]|nr:MAG: ABC transporter permease [Deltaproteobacteria bacterium]